MNKRFEEGCCPAPTDSNLFRFRKIFLEGPLVSGHENPQANRPEKGSSLTAKSGPASGKTSQGGFFPFESCVDVVAWSAKTVFGG